MRGVDRGEYTAHVFQKRVPRWQRKRCRTIVVPSGADAALGMSPAGRISTTFPFEGVARKVCLHVVVRTRRVPQREADAVRLRRRPPRELVVGQVIDDRKDARTSLLATRAKEIKRIHGRGA